MAGNDKYEAVIGLEVHVQLLTKSKAYSGDINEYGVPPNTNVSVITLGHPGTLPKLNIKTAEYAVKLGLACNCSIRHENYFARKNYFYADLPKGYQITQHEYPICTGGFVQVKDAEGKDKKIRLIRIHMEEDSGKSIHDQDPYDTLIDLNRAGVPLLEVVSEPDLRSGEEAYNYLAEIRKLVRYLDICDGNMEEGSLRCDANISIRPVGSEPFGTKVEVKNMNSLRNVQRAIDYEIKRQIKAKETGERIVQETRSFDAVSGTTFSMRTKEEAMDYRYFPEPDLPPLILSEEFINEIKAKLPALPQELFRKYTTELGLSEYDANIVTETKEIALYFEEVINHTENYKAAVNMVMGPVKSWLNEKGVGIKELKVDPGQIAQLIQLIDTGKISHSVATQKVFHEMLNHPGKDPESIAKDNNWIQESDSGALEGYVKEAIAKYPDKVQEYRAGKTGLVGLFMGEVMKLSKGKADPKIANVLVRKMLEDNN